MPRPLRSYLPGSTLHIVQRGHNRERCFHDDQDHQHYLGLLGEQSRKHGCDLHAYVLMPNHVHLLLTVHERNSQSWFMRDVAQQTTYWYHQRHGGCGTMWERRYHASHIADETHLLMCYRYIELNPVRAGMVDFPGGFRWSSYRGNAEGRADDLLTPHPLFAAFGRVAYRALFDLPLADKDLDRIRFAINNDFALGRPSKPVNRGQA